MSFVFISHASEDKPRLKPIVEALMAAGLKVWVDNPVAMGFPRERLSEFYRIHAGARWEDEIHEALRECACVLACWSKRATDPRVLSGENRLVWLNEIGVGLTMRKLVACTIDDVDVAALPGTYAQQQTHCVNADLLPQTFEASLHALIEDVRRKLKSQFSDDRARTRMRCCFAPLLANREEQEAIVREAIADVASSPGVKPVIVAAPANELLDEFRERMGDVSAQLLPGGSRWWDVNVGWPVKVGPKNFESTYRRLLWCALRIAPRADNHIVADVLEGKGRPVAILHSIRIQEWDREEPQRIQAWVSYWRALALAAPNLRVIPWLQVKMDAVSPGWRESPPGQARVVWNAIRATREKLSDTTAAVIVPPVLPPIGQGDADRWLDEVQPDLGPRRRRLEDEIGSLYREAGLFDRLRGRSPRKHGINHATFARALEPLFTES